MATLGVNIDHVATLREARRTIEPDPVWAAAAAELGGADGITIHLREDRRHIQDRDLEVLKKTVQVKLNLELAMHPLMVDIACRAAPDQVTLVPEKPRGGNHRGWTGRCPSQKGISSYDWKITRRRDRRITIYRSRT